MTAVAAVELISRLAPSFAFRDFRLLWVSTLLQSTSMGMIWVVTGWLVFEITDSPFMVGLSSALTMLPFFVLGLVSGAVADRVERRTLLITVTLGGVVVSLIIGAVLITDIAHLWHILALITAGGCVTAFQMTTRQSLTYDIVGPRLALNGMSLNSVSMQVGTVVGSLISGVIISRYGAGGQFILISAMYFASVVFLLPVSTRREIAIGQRASVARNLVDYVGIMRTNRVLVTLMGLAALTEIFGFTHMSLLPVIAKDVLGLGPIGLGVMTAIRQIGGIAGLLALSSMGSFRYKGLLMFGIMGAFGASLMALLISTNLVHYVLMLTLATGCAMSVDTLYMTLMQENVPNEQRGRAMGAWTLSIGVAPVGHLGLGGLAGAVGAPLALFASGSVLVVGSLITAVALPRIRRLG